MLAWLADLWRPGRAEEGMDDLRRERRRLQEILTCYREFGFEALELDTRLRITRLDRRIRAIEKTRSAS
jgi:hypothetical protein